MKIEIDDAELQKAAASGMDDFLGLITSSIRTAIGNELTEQTMAELTAPQITLLAYDTLREEVMDGGFVQLIHNGYGPFIFMNPFAKVMKMWGLRDLSKLIYEGLQLFKKHHEELERDCTDEEFMALFERFPEFDDLDDEFVENEEQYTAALAYYVDEHLSDFIEVKQENAQSANSGC